MNHGKCKNCWWYKLLHGDGYDLINNRIFLNEGDGICYMHTVNPGKDYEELSIVKGGSWCPDYTNRTKTNRTDKITLENWLASLK